MQENGGSPQIEEGILEEINKCTDWVEDRKLPYNSKLDGQGSVHSHCNH